MLVEPNPYPAGCSIRYRVPYAETDNMGVVYHAEYLVYFERLRNELIRLSGKSYREIEAEGLLFPVTELAAEYHQSARYDDLLLVHGHFAWLQGSRFRIDYRVERDGELLVTGHTVHTTITKDGLPRRLPALLLEHFGPEAGPSPAD